MKFTKHAKARMNQRGFSKMVTKIILEHGRFEKAPGGAVRVFFGNREYRDLVSEIKRHLQMADKARNRALIMKDGLILTVYSRD